MKDWANFLAEELNQTIGGHAIDRRSIVPPKTCRRAPTRTDADGTPENPLPQKEWARKYNTMSAEERTFAYAAAKKVTVRGGNMINTKELVELYKHMRADSPLDAKGKLKKTHQFANISKKAFIDAGMTEDVHDKFNKPAPSSFLKSPGLYSKKTGKLLLRERTTSASRYSPDERHLCLVASKSEGLADHRLTRMVDEDTKLTKALDELQKDERQFGDKGTQIDSKMKRSWIRARDTLDEQMSRYSDQPTAGQTKKNRRAAREEHAKVQKKKRADKTAAAARNKAVIWDDEEDSQEEEVEVDPLDYLHPIDRRNNDPEDDDDSAPAGQAVQPGSLRSV
jgi:hypothetical protein